MPLATELKDIITYAYRGNNKYVLLMCVIVSAVARYADMSPYFGPVAGLLLSAYLCAVYFQMIQSSATGGMEAPEFLHTTDLVQDIIWPMVQVYLVGLVSFAPWLVYSYWSGEEPFKSMIGSGLIGLGVIYLPMAMLAVAVLGTGALSPHIVIPAIFHGGWLYWVSVVLLCLLYLAESIIGSAFSRSLTYTLVMALVGGYTLMTSARILGVVYRERQDELRWL
jgi:hypothetical protein